MHRLVASHAPEFTEVNVTMAQAKVLYVVMAAGRLRMSELAARLGIGSSSASELADRLVEMGLLIRSQAPDDRRQVVVSATPDAEALLERFRELNQRQLRELLDQLETDELEIIERSLEVFGLAIDRRAAAVTTRRQHHRRRHHRRRHHRPGRDPLVSRLSRIAISKRSVTLLFAAALFVAGLSAWGNLKQELLPDIKFPVITVVTPFPGAGSSDVATQVTRPIESAIGAIPRLVTIQSTSSNSISLVVTQFSFGTDVTATTCGDPGRAGQGVSAGQRRARRPGARHQRLAGRHLVDRLDHHRVASTRSPRSRGPRSCRRSPRSRVSPGRT